VISLQAARVVAAVSLGLLGCVASAKKPAPDAAPVPVEILTLAPSPVRDTGEYLGNVVSRQNVTIVPQVSGYVRKVLVKPGDAVKAGATLVELDARQEQAALASADAQQRAAASNEELATKTLERARALHREGLLTSQDLDQAQARAQAAEAERGAASARASEQRVGVGFHVVRAPFAGTVGDVAARVGDFVNATTTLTTITQGETLELEIKIPPERARLVKTGTPVEVLSADGALLLTTSLYFIAPETDPRTQLVDVSAVFKNDVGLRPSELVRTRIIYGSSEALQVPVLSLVRQSGQAFVYAVEQKPAGLTVTRRPITLGVLAEQRYVVKKGLVAGDRIAVSSLQALRDGARVVEKPAAAPRASTP